MIKIINSFEKIIVYILILLLAIIIFVSTIELGYKIVVELMKPPLFLLNTQNFQVLFGFFFMVLIGLELLETVKAYITADKFHVEVVFLVAMIAVARKVIILDYNDSSPEMLFGISCLIITLSVGYYFLKKVLPGNRSKH